MKNGCRVFPEHKVMCSGCLFHATATECLAFFTQLSILSNLSKPCTFLSINRSFTSNMMCVCDYSHIVDELKELALPFLQILLQHICFQVNPPAHADPPLLCSRPVKIKIVQSAHFNCLCCSYEGTSQHVGSALTVGQMSVLVESFVVPVFFFSWCIAVM